MRSYPLDRLAGGIDQVSIHAPRDGERPQYLGKKIFIYLDIGLSVYLFYVILLFFAEYLIFKVPKCCEPERETLFS